MPGLRYLFEDMKGRVFEQILISSMDHVEVCEAVRVAMELSG